MSTLDKNKSVCRAFLTHIGRRQFDDALALVHDNVVWWLQGDFARSGFREGKDTLFTNLAQVLATDLELEFGHLTAEEDRVAVEMESRGKLANGKDYRNSYHYLFFVKDGKIRECHEYLDTKHLAEVMFD